MQELSAIAFSPPIIGYTILLMVFLLYWLTVIIGVFDFSSMDIDFDMDVDVDVDVDVDADVDSDIDASGGGNVFLAFLGFFNFGKIPFMVVMSVLSLCLWTIAILIHFYLSDGSALFAVIMFLPNLFMSLVITKIVTSPLVPLFAAIARDEAKEIDYIGLIGTVISPASKKQIGQAEFESNKNHLMLMVKTVEDYEGMISADTKVIIAYHDDGKDVFYVRPIAEE